MNILSKFIRSGVPVVLLLCLLQAFLCVFLCVQFYKTNGPFYDSLSYHLTLASIVNKAQSEGVLSALRLALHGSTIFLPMATGAVIGPFVGGLHRSLGVWVQFPWVVALVLSVRHCLIAWLKMDKVVATFASLLFISIHAVYFFNGGLPDFRMDLLLYLLYGCSICWFLVALESERWRDWLLCSIFCSAACLSRATAPVYLSLTMLALTAIHLCFFSVKKVRATGKGLGIVAATVVLCSGWFYWINFKNLYYYYVIWNPDANAHLSLSESIRHIQFTLQSVGWWVIDGGLAILAVAVVAGVLQKQSYVLLSTHYSDKVLKALAVGVVPVAFLVLRGAGLNPFVSMPGAFGVLLFLLVCASWGLRAPSPTVRWLAVLLALITACASAGAGVVNFGPSPEFHSDVKGYLTLAERMEQDARLHGKQKVRPCVITIGAFTGRGLMSVMLFDGGYRLLDGLELAKNEIVFNMDWRFYDPSALVEWDGLPVQGESERIKYLAQQAQHNMTYLIAPDDTTLEHLPQHCYINTVSRQLRDAILAGGGWELISSGVQLAPQEHYTVYANRKRTEP
jgi:hypothetical protein